jgi:uncharacterized membrane protein YqaE (UPF0057 family)
VVFTVFLNLDHILTAWLFISVLKQMEFCICLLLTILGYIPGIIYAVYVLVALDRDDYQREYYAVA